MQKTTSCWSRAVECQVANILELTRDMWPKEETEPRMSLRTVHWRISDREGLTYHRAADVFPLEDVVQAVDKAYTESLRSEE